MSDSDTDVSSTTTTMTSSGRASREPTPAQYDGDQYGPNAGDLPTGDEENEEKGNGEEDGESGDEGDGEDKEGDERSEWGEENDVNSRPAYGEITDERMLRQIYRMKENDFVSKPLHLHKQLQYEGHVRANPWEPLDPSLEEWKRNKIKRDRMRQFKHFWSEGAQNFIDEQKKIRRRRRMMQRMVEQREEKTASLKRKGRKKTRGPSKRAKREESPSIDSEEDSPMVDEDELEEEEELENDGEEDEGLEGEADDGEADKVEGVDEELEEDFMAQYLDVIAAPQKIIWEDGIETDAPLPPLDAQRIVRFAQGAQMIRDVSLENRVAVLSSMAEFSAYGRSLLSRGVNIVIKQCGPEYIREFTMEGLRKEGILPDIYLQSIDNNLKGQKSASGYHRWMPLADIMEEIGKKAGVRHILDVKSYGGHIPAEIEEMDDICLAWTNTASAIGPDGHTYDIQGSRRWHVLSDRRQASGLHVDADGYLTWSVTASGWKRWGMAFPRGLYDDDENGASKKDLSRDEVFDELAKFTDGNDEKTLKEVDRSQRCFVDLYPGDMVIMAPNQLHSVFTPEATWVTGGHFYLLDAMHLTEVCRRFLHEFGTEITNAEHDSCPETIARLLISLSFIDRKVPRRALLALVVMNYFPIRYLTNDQMSKLYSKLPQSSKKRHLALNAIIRNSERPNGIFSGDVFLRAKSLARHLLFKIFKKNGNLTYDDASDLLDKETGGDWRDPGELVEVATHAMHWYQAELLPTLRESDGKRERSPQDEESFEVRVVFESDDY